MLDSQARRSVLAAVAGTAALGGCLEGTLESDSESSGVSENGTSAEDGGDATVDAWDETALEDVTTGESFSIADLEPPVVVHTFASYCPTCQRQEDELGAVWDDLADDGADTSIVSLAITDGDEPADVAAHAAENGYEWWFAVASEALVDALVDEFGYDISVHAESPLVVRRADGSTETLEKVAPAAEIRAAVDG
ncbi:hypothetical protein [Natrarchaeobaculum aegyptiacum]|uniref:Thioredoxin domain-containing protein n=1 Tax=Natrarchaeobaculum aegyptiacum TaxID=745377 RepID=A0A2Z2HQP3_9EURY|nr:hypothetical protein [Natrarchaeobaculum aegyptiacum]ARS89441.1 hypothetical protein B1756_06575 [Natrarchaeobaculum aegyptiacum]